MLHAHYLADETFWFAVYGQDWLLAYTWVLTGLAILGALKASSGTRSGALPGTASGAPPPDSPLARRPERLLVLVFFPVVIGLDPGWYVNNTAVVWIWLFVHMAALRLMTGTGTGRTVLGLPLDGTEEPLRATATPALRDLLLERARRYREIHATLRRLDQGQSDDTAVERRSLERELSGLHDWEDRQGTPRRLPARISVVDAALALGPKDTWWANGKRGAVLATLFGLPATLLTTWASHIRGDGWTTALHYGFGLPDILLAFLYWQFGWTGAGFLLGALWRVLPGRRGAGKALPVAGAFALPIALDALARRAMDESQDNLALYAATMLLVLTCTGIAMDLETFRGEGRYWQSRLGLCSPSTRCGTCPCRSPTSWFRLPVSSPSGSSSRTPADRRRPARVTRMPAGSRPGRGCAVRRGRPCTTPAGTRRVRPVTNRPPPPLNRASV